MLLSIVASCDVIRGNDEGHHLRSFRRSREAAVGVPLPVDYSLQRHGICVSCATRVDEK